MKNKEKINKFLTKAMDECWHEINPKIITRNDAVGRFGENSLGNHYECSCGAFYDGIWNDFSVIKEDHADFKNNQNNNFSSPDGFFKLWNWAIEQDWWCKFSKSCISSNEKYKRIVSWHVDINLINPERFAKAVYEYLKEK